MKKWFLLNALLLSSAGAMAQNLDPSTLPAPVQGIAKQGITIIKKFDAPGGMTGYLGKYQDMGVTIYLTPDGKHAVSGYLYDARGTNLSEQVINHELYTPAGREMWKKMASAPWIADGSAQAPHIIYVFADPFCPYCHTFWQRARPWVEAGKVQIRTLLVGVIKPESAGYAAAIMASKDPAKTWHDFEQSNGKLKITPSARASADQAAAIKTNTELMDALGASGTPAIYYMTKDQVLQQEVGLPEEEKMPVIMGDK
ncbi:thiol:disulfide interchange protein DsbG [Shimwellia blattae]|uniref:Thiol:disulfide interchange protein n=1 Tax=Shimwellia blattae (strain ATCC 29907 / DSM 4481 / JCM 1650 / NBRC 105725 / CDC 9005-74) TaxID=630626 RepID=I2B7J8_SHIBC|nr:thiol:disulfide interchange protein DsbG [Shimwellia blattae]AFJ46502.1 thiol:disulfide interchange protein DsbG precursor [Shimwellia blattae DSM 4481 = NBRC 105725]GAB80082.1 thiol--disulfide interchange protein DsbG [Shimwellia blattae DSM 4481 = NBRC 105725]VDY63971.1 Thiol:disulfide interchange protein DsbG precursor [Shimwellia blattae]VEC22107.1 Thiol:disulfide interchange protein DsbG precursor [Shimwellia blattae]